MPDDCPESFSFPFISPQINCIPSFTKEWPPWQKKKAHAIKAPRQHDDSTNVTWEAGLVGERCPSMWRISLKEQFPNPTCKQTKNDHRNQKWPSQPGNSFYTLNSTMPILDWFSSMDKLQLMQHLLAVPDASSPAGVCTVGRGFLCMCTKSACISSAKMKRAFWSQFADDSRGWNCYHYIATTQR